MAGTCKIARTSSVLLPYPPVSCLSMLGEREKKTSHLPRLAVRRWSRAFVVRITPKSAELSDTDLTRVGNFRPRSISSRTGAVVGRGRRLVGDDSRNLACLIAAVTSVVSRRVVLVLTTPLIRPVAVCTGALAVGHSTRATAIVQHRS